MSKDLLKVSIEELPIGICRVDPTGSVIYVNRQWSEITTLSPETIYQQGWYGHLSDKFQIDFYTEWQNKISLGISFSQEYPFNTAVDVRWGIVQWTPLKNARGQLTGYLGTLTDTSSLPHHHHKDNQPTYPLANEQEDQPESLIEAEERYRKLVELSPDVIAIHQDGKIVFANPAAYRYLGNIKPEVLAEKSIIDFVHPDSRQGTIERIRKIILNGESVPFVEEKMLLPDGTILFSETAGVPFSYRKRPAVLVVLRDITQQKRIISALAESEERYRGLVELSPDAIAVHQNFKIVFVNRVFSNLVGAPNPESLIGVDFLSIIHSEDRDFVRKCQEEIVQQGKESPLMEQKLIRLDGQEILVEAACCFCAYQNQPAVQIVARDITQRKHAEEVLRESESRFRAIFDQSLDPIVLLKKDSHILFNPAYHKLFGYDADEMEGKSFFDLIAPSQKETVINYSNQHAPESYISMAYETRGIRKDGSEFMMEIHASAYRVQEEFYTVALIRDITERKLAEFELRRLNRALKTINDSKQALGRATEEIKLLQDICRIICQNGGHALAWVGYVTHQEDNPIRLVAWYSSDEQFFHSTHSALTDAGSIPGPTLIAINSNEIAIQSNSERQAYLKTEQEANNQHGYASSMAIPLKFNVDKLPFGVLTIYSTETNAFDSSEVMLLQELAEDMSHGIQSLQLQQEHAMAEMTLRESEDRFRTTFEQSAVGFAHVTPKGRILRVNQWFCDILGYTQDELTAMRFDQITHPDFIEKDLREIQKIVRGESHQYITDKQYIHKDGSFIWAHLTVSPLREENGQVVFFSAVIEDISQRKQFEIVLNDERSSLERKIDERTSELKLANAELERAARLKDEFLASMSHELRTPLTSILGLSEALQKQIYGELNPKQIRSLQFIEESGQHLLSLINDILDLSKIEAGKFELEPEINSLESICQASLQFIKENAHKKRISISHVFDENIGLIIADSRRLKQIMVNLLSNAVKFTPEGGKVGLEAMGDQENKQLILTVWDTGIGIDEKDFPSLFLPFVQLDSGLSRHYDGSGLGLSLVQRLVALHGGTITVESKLGRGSRFIIKIPWQIPNS